MHTPFNSSADYGQLLTIARASIANALGHPYPSDESFPFLAEKGACFVTLTYQQALRGCIGTIEAWRPLLEDVKENALAAAFHDPRFQPLTRSELHTINIEVSLLSPKTPILFTNEADLLDQLRPGTDGVVIEFGYFRGTFLPQVWEQLPSPPEFMQHLKHKAGLPPDFWSDNMEIYRYEVSKLSEIDLYGE